MQKDIFGRLIHLPNMLQAAGDRYLSGDDITIRQWIFTAAVAQFGDTPPTLGEVSKVLQSSHQNAKQLVLKLEEKGFVDIVSDVKDRRVTRLMLTGKYYCFWEKHQREVELLLSQIFKDVDKDEINTLCNCLNKMFQSVLKAEKSLS